MSRGLEARLKKLEKRCGPAVSLATELWYCTSEEDGR